MKTEKRLLVLSIMLSTSLSGCLALLPRGGITQHESTIESRNLCSDREQQKIYQLTSTNEKERFIVIVECTKKEGKIVLLNNLGLRIKSLALSDSRITESNERYFSQPISYKHLLRILTCQVKKANLASKDTIFEEDYYIDNNCKDIDELSIQLEGWRLTSSPEVIEVKPLTR